MQSSKKNTTPKIKVKRNEKEMNFDIVDEYDRTVYSFHCNYIIQFYYINYAIRRAKTFKEVQELIKDFPRNDKEYPK